MIKMKCAMSLMATSAIRARENEEARRVAKRQEDEARQERTIRLCEQLGEELEQRANEGKTPKIIFCCDKYHYRPLKSTTSEYSDHRVSFIPQGQGIDLKVMRNWFAQFCFELEVTEFPYWYYGCGRVRGYQIMIKPNPACI
jgi:hypothetical protein